MNETSNIVPLGQPDEIDDPLTNLLRAGARQLLPQARLRSGYISPR
jgi:putative transposase